MLIITIIRIKNLKRDKDKTIYYIIMVYRFIKSNIHKVIPLNPINFISYKVSKYFEPPKLNIIIDGKFTNIEPITITNRPYIDVVLKNDSNSNIHIKKITLQDKDGKECNHFHNLVYENDNSVWFSWNNWNRIAYGFSMDKNLFYTLSRLTILNSSLYNINSKIVEGEKYKNIDKCLWVIRNIIYVKNKELYDDTRYYNQKIKDNDSGMILELKPIHTLYTEWFHSYLESLSSKELKFKVYYEYFRVPFIGFVLTGDKTFAIRYKDINDK